MTKEELEEIKMEKAKNKMKSRTLWISIIWTAFVPLAIIAQVLLKTIEIPIERIVEFAGAITLVYIGGNKASNMVLASKLDKESKG